MNIKIFSLLNKKKKFELKLIFFLSSIYFFLEFASLSSIPVFVGILINPELILKKVENLTNLEIIGTYSNSDYQMFFAALVIFLFIIKNLYLVLITIYESGFLQRFKISISNKLFNFYAKLPYSYHLKNKINLSKVRMTLDTKRDFRKIKKIFEFYHPDIFFGTNKILKLKKILNL